MEATGDRRASTQSRRGSPARQSGPATQATRVRQLYRRLAGAIPLVVTHTPHGWAAPRAAAQRKDMWPYPWTHVGTLSHLEHTDRVAATMPSQAHAGAAQESPDIGQWAGQDVPLVRPSSCIVKRGIPSSQRYLPTYLLSPRRHRHCLILQACPIPFPFLSPASCYSRGFLFRLQYPELVQLGQCFSALAG